MTAINQEIDILKKNLPAYRFSSTRKFEVLPGYSVENHFMYPDILSLSKSEDRSDETARDSWLFKMGAANFGMVAQFAERQVLRVGNHSDR